MTRDCPCQRNTVNPKPTQQPFNRDSYLTPKHENRPHIQVKIFRSPLVDSYMGNDISQVCKQKKCSKQIATVAYAFLADGNLKPLQEAYELPILIGDHYFISGVRSVPNPVTDLTFGMVILLPAVLHRLAYWISILRSHSA